MCCAKTQIPPTIFGTLSNDTQPRSRYVKLKINKTDYVVILYDIAH